MCVCVCVCQGHKSPRASGLLKAEWGLAIGPEMFCGHTHESGMKGYIPLSYRMPAARGLFQGGI